MTTSVSATTTASQAASSQSEVSISRQWLQNRLQQMGRTSLQDLTPQERLRLQDDARRDSQSMYICNCIKAVGVSVAGLFAIAGAATVLGGALFGLVLFAQDSVLIPAAGAALILVGLAVKKGIECGPSFMQRFFIQPFAEANDLNELARN
jgi:hypothetical protein